MDPLKVQLGSSPDLPGGAMAHSCIRTAKKRLQLDALLFETRRHVGSSRHCLQSDREVNGRTGKPITGPCRGRPAAPAARRHAPAICRLGGRGPLLVMAADECSVTHTPPSSVPNAAAARWGHAATEHMVPVPPPPLHLPITVHRAGFKITRASERIHYRSWKLIDHLHADACVCQGLLKSARV